MSKVIDVQGLQSGLTTAATTLSGPMIVQAATIGLVVAFLVGVFSFRAGVWVAGGVVAAAVGASISPDFAQWLYTTFHTGGGYSL